MEYLDPWVPVSDLETDGVPIIPASTMIILDDRPDLKVLMLLRNNFSAFVAGHSIFPGGAVDEDDKNPVWGAFSEGLSDKEAKDRLKVENAKAFWIAAIRETIEEAGMVVGTNDISVVQDRELLDEGKVSFSELIVKRKLSLDLKALKPVSRWVTPIGGPRRYDTYFFVASLSNSVKASADGKEAVEAFWITPTEALKRWKAKEMVMISPTLATLKSLQGYKTVQEVFDCLEERALPENIRVVDEYNALPLFPCEQDYKKTGTWSSLGWTWLPIKEN